MKRVLLFFLLMPFLGGVETAHAQAGTGQLMGVNVRGDSVVVDVLPKFQGQPVSALIPWAGSQVVYPDVEAEGRVVISFNVNPDGSLSDFEVVQSPHPALAKEVIRVISASSGWEPGMSAGEPVRVNYKFPMDFRKKPRRRR